MNEMNICVTCLTFWTNILAEVFDIEAGGLPDMTDQAPRRDRTHWLYIAVLVAVVGGVAVGLIAPGVGKDIAVLGTLFVNLIKMMICLLYTSDAADDCCRV